jgi:hypothetical protein
VSFGFRVRTDKNRTKVADLFVICKKKFQEGLGNLNFNVWPWPISVKAVCVFSLPDKGWSDGGY